MKFSNVIVIKACAIVGVMGFAAILHASLAQESTNIPSPKVEGAVKSFEIERLDAGGIVSLADYRGKWVVVNFWASWCPPCRREHGALLEVSKQFSDHPEVQFLGVNFRDRKSNALNFLKELGAFPYPLGVDPGHITGIEFDVYGLPATYFLNPEGKIVARHSGAITADILRKNLPQFLEGQNYGS